MWEGLVLLGDMAAEVDTYAGKQRIFERFPAIWSNKIDKSLPIRPETRSVCGPFKSFQPK